MSAPIVKPTLVPSQLSSEPPSMSQTTAQIAPMPATVPQVNPVNLQPMSQNMQQQMTNNPVPVQQQQQQQVNPITTSPNKPAINATQVILYTVKSLIT